MTEGSRAATPGPPGGSLVCQLRGGSASPAAARLPLTPSLPGSCRALLVTNLTTFQLPGREEPRVSTDNCRNTEQSAGVEKAAGAGSSSLPWGTSVQTLLTLQAEMVWDLGKTPLAVTQSHQLYWKDRVNGP